MFLRVTLLKVIVLSNFFLKNDGIFKDLIQTVGVYLTSFTGFFSRVIKKKSSENEQSTGHFQSFYFFLFLSRGPKSEKKFPLIN